VDAFGVGVVIRSVCWGGLKVGRGHWKVDEEENWVVCAVTRGP
jgi:hypothetical protein